jgi:6-phosphogluconate dehydrogenase
LNSGSFDARYELVGDAIPEHNLRNIFRRMCIIRAVFKSDFDKTFENSMSTTFRDGELEIRKLVGIMRKIKSGYRVRPMYFEREARQSTSEQHLQPAE